MKKRSEFCSGSIFLLTLFFFKIQSLNVTRLLEFHLTLCGPSNFCNKSIFNFPNKQENKDFQQCKRCFCDDSCFWKHDCCVDKYFELGELSCVNVTSVTLNTTRDIHRNQASFLMVKTCPEHSDRQIQEKCENVANAVDKLRYPPVTSNTMGISYANKFCAECHMEEKYQTWDNDVICELFFDLNFLSSFEEVVLNAKDKNCVIQAVPPISSPPGNCSHAKYVNHCNKTGTWPSRDEDIFEACNSYFINDDPPFTNTFCRMCNPPLQTDDIIMHCNATGKWDIFDLSINNSCEYFRENPATSPYKNVFCTMCNSNSSLGSANEKPVPFGGRKWRPTFRNLFSVNNYNEEVTAPSQETHCSAAQFYDPIIESCRNITCFPGKILINDSCHPLVKKTKYLSCSLDVGFTAITSTSIPVQQIVARLERLLIERLQAQFKSSTFDYLETLTIQVDQPCRVTHPYSSDINGNFYMELFITENVLRFETEVFLISFLNFTSTLVNGIVRITIHFDSQISENFSYIRNESRCTTTFLSLPKTTVSRKLYRTIAVSNLLICKQFVLTNDEFNIAEENSLLILRKHNLVFHQYSFYDSKDGTARICLQEFLSALDSKLNIPPSWKSNLYRYILIALNAISILALVVTFSIYCKMKNLQTLAGKLIMLLMFLLTISLILFQLSRLGDISYELCVVFGIVLHYTWIASFLCMTSCSFHMDRVFRGLHIYPQPNQSTIFRKYVAIIITGPMVIVSANIIVTFTIENDDTIGYGLDKCFIDIKISRIASFVVPVAILCFLNLVFFIRTAISIKTCTNISVSKRNRNDFVIFLRLFTVTGVTWIFQVIDGFLPFSIFSYVSEIVNSLQGFAIFMAFVCNKRIINECRKKYTEHRQRGKPAEQTEVWLSTGENIGTFSTTL